MKLGLGTAQFGMAYGATNQAGQVPVEEVAGILRYCQKLGIEILDTAWLYGDAEKVLGNVSPGLKGFKVVTKVYGLDEGTDIEKTFDEHFSKTLRDLKLQSVYALLVHTAENLLGPDGDRVWALFQNARDHGLAQKIGVSTYTPEEALELSRRYDLDIIQAPCNLVDQRLSEQGVLSHLKDKQVEIHARSIFLQGLLLSPPDQLPDRLSSFKNVLSQIFALMESEDITPMEACLGYVESRSEIDSVIVGVSGLQELESIVATERRLGDRAQGVSYTDFSVSDEILLNPSKWPAN